MRYDTTITSKGTITIAAPIRKALGLKPGQRVSLSVDKNHKVVIDRGTNVLEFESLRDKIIQKIPSHKKGLTGQALKEATAQAWANNYRDEQP